MPLYEYRCAACDYQFEQLRRLDDHVDSCPECGGMLQQLFGTFQFHFRSRGWKPYSPESAAGGESVREEICVG